jgi:hypothetical protein
MMIRLFLALMLALSAPAFAEPQPAPETLWRPSADRITFTTAQLSFPRQIGTLRQTEAQEFSHAGEGTDSGLKYASSDRRLFATVYVYLPGLPDAALTAFMTDSVIRQQSPQVQSTGFRVVSAGGEAGVALRADYSGYRDGLASSAAFIRAGNWIVKLRVSGPDERRAEVVEAMSALIDGLRFEGTVRASPAALFEIDGCNDSFPAARAVAETQAAITAAAIIAAGYHVQDGNRPGNGRIGLRWCQTRLREGQTTRLILRSSGTRAGSGSRRNTVLLVPINDAGTTLEMVETLETRQLVVLYHQIGSTAVLGQYDAPLSDEQILALLNGSDRTGGRFRATIGLRPNGDSNITLPQTSSGNRPPTT